MSAMPHMDSAKVIRNGDAWLKVNCCFAPKEGFKYLLMKSVRRVAF